MATTEDPLTDKQEAFCLAYVKHGDGLRAYREAGYSEKMSDKSATEAASRLLRNPKVVARIAAIRGPAAKKAGMTLESHLEDLKRLRNSAVKDRKWAAAITAEIARGKAAGLYVEHHELTGPDGGPIQQNVQGGVNEEAVRAIVRDLRSEFLGGDQAGSD